MAGGRHCDRPRVGAGVTFRRLWIAYPAFRRGLRASGNNALTFGPAVVLAVAIFFELTQCSYAQEPSRSMFDQVFVQEPKLNFVTLQIIWTPKEQIKDRCLPNSAACATVGRWDGDLVYIWAPKPTSFSAREVCALGHELLHSFGARHQ